MDNATDQSMPEENHPQQEMQYSNEIFMPGEEVILQDSKNRRYLITLVPGKTFHSHSGAVEHDFVIGKKNASYIKARYAESGIDRERYYLAIKPTLADVILKMPRGAQVIYPKDLGAILMAADVYPGARILESGIGSGALSMTLLRAGAIVKGYEIRQDFIELACENIEKHRKQIFGYDSGNNSDIAARFSVECRDVYQGIDETDLDRILLDLPEPWQVVPFAQKALKAGGIFLAYLPTINQTTALRECLRENKFILSETLEVLNRTWHIEGNSVRPDHRMVAHTGFITVARNNAGDSAT